MPPIRSSSEPRPGTGKRRLPMHTLQTMISRSRIFRVSRSTLALLVFAMSVSGAAAFAQQQSSIAGDYTGTVDSTHTLRLHLRLNAQGELMGSFDIPDQYEAGDALEDIHFEGQTLRFSIAGHNGFWEGIFSSDGSSLTGKWSEWGVLTTQNFTRDVSS